MFCDSKATLRRQWAKIVATSDVDALSTSFLVEDVRVAVDQVERIDVLFYRRDSAGEGGSGVFVLGDSFLPKVLRRFPEHGGYIITDGSNSRGRNFEKMISSRGFTNYGWFLRRANEQPFLSSHGLTVITVQRGESAIQCSEIVRSAPRKNELF